MKMLWFFPIIFAFVLSFTSQNVGQQNMQHSAKQAQTKVSLVDSIPYATSMQETNRLIESAEQQVQADKQGSRFILIRAKNLKNLQENKNIPKLLPKKEGDYK